MIAKPAITDSVRHMFIPGFGGAQREFAAQFERDGPGHLYRRDSKAAPVRVSDEERDAFIKSFDRLLLLDFILLVIGTVAVILWAAFETLSTGEAVSKTRMFLGLGVLMAAFMGLYSWAWTAPARALSGRMAFGSALTKHEIERKSFERLPWINFPIGGAMIVFGYYKVTGGHDFLSGTNLLWLILAIGGLGLMIVQAWRKWRFDRRDKG
jgi:hypothetical protein